MRTFNNISGKIEFYISRINDIESARPLDMLSKMEASEEALLKMIRTLKAGIEYGNQVIVEMARLSGAVPDEVINQIEDEQNGLLTTYQYFREFRAELTESNDLIFKDGDNYLATLDEAIETTKRLHEQLETLRWIILEHNVDVAPKGKASIMSSPDEIEEFFASL